MSKPTPRPWNVDVREKSVGDWPDDKDVLDHLVLLGAVKHDGWQTVIGHVSPRNPDEPTARANAAHIVKCVNLHDELVTALEDAEHWLGQAWACIEHIKEKAPTYERKAAIDMLREVSRAAMFARNALAKAEAE